MRTATIMRSEIRAGLRRLIIRQDPPPPWVYFSRLWSQSLNFFSVWKLLKKNEKWRHFCAHAQWWSPWRLAAVQYNGRVSRFFEVSRGVRQGCPLSPLLYVLGAEILARAIRENKKIKGVPTGKNQRFKISQAPFTRRRCENDRYEIVPIRKEIFPDRPPVYTKTIRIRKLLKKIRRR